MQKHNTFRRLFISIGVFFGRILLWIVRTLWSLKPKYVGLSLVSAGLVAGSFLFFSGRIHRIFADGEISEVWNFSTSGDYVASSGVTLDSSNTESRLSVKNYTSDSDTAALYHFDESNGNVASDVSSYTNNASIASGTGSFGSGSLNNALTLNGSTTFVSAGDVAATSLTGNFTVEAWTKFASGFSNTTSRNRQGVLDKGVYQLYYDNETGKVVFETEPNSAVSAAWTQVGGPDLLNQNGASQNIEFNRSWDANSKNFIWQQIVIGSDIYVALGSITTGVTVTGDAEVWKCTNCSTSPVWSKVGGDGLNSSWEDGTYEDASSLVTDGTNLYVGLGNRSNEAEVWRYKSGSWLQIGGDSLNSSWTSATGPYERVTSMVADGTTIYAGLGTTAGDAEVWKCTSCDGASPSWSKVGGDGSGSGVQSWATGTYEEVTALALVNGTTLAVGLGTSAGDGELWTCATSSCTVTTGWTKRGGDATGSGGQSWANTIEEVRSIGSNGTLIYVGLGNSTTDADVWRCDIGGTCTTTSGWTQVGGDGVGSSWNTNYERVWSLLVDGTTVYAGIGDTAGDAEVWKCTSCDGGSPSWSQIGGDGTGVPPQSWGNQTGASFLYASSLAKIGNVIFVGASSSAGTSGAEVWQCDTSGTCSNTAGWTRVAGNYLNKSWGAFNLNSVESMATSGGKLYAGTGYDTGAATSNGNARVWEFDGTNWSLIGGQGINSSWTYGHPSVSTVTYRTVSSMTGYNGNLFVGLGGGTNGDAEVWKWDGATWTKIGGDSDGTGDNSWAAGTKRSVPAMLTIGNKLYVGLQGTAAGDGELWVCDLSGTCDTTTGWTFLGGDPTGAGGLSWNNSMFEAVWSLTSRGTVIYAGLGSSTNDAEVWTADTASGTRTTGWTKLGGDGANSSWNTNYEEVTALSWYRNELYAGLGSGTGDAEVWKWNGSSWGGAAVAGDGIGTSWDDLIYERVKAFSTYNGNLIAALGDSAGDGEVWQYDSNSWTKIGGDGTRSGWTNVIERIAALAVYQGKLYAGSGLTANSDATVWAYGANDIVQSSATSWDSNWHHLAVTSNGSTLRLFVDGTQVDSKSVSAFPANTVHPLVLGGLAGGGQYAGSAPAILNGSIDEIRVSTSVRSSFQSTPYSTGYETVTLASAVHTSGVKKWDSFVTDEDAPGSITYRLSSNGGSTWQYWSGSAWATSSGYAQSNDASTISTNIPTFPAGSGGLLWQAIFLGNGNELVRLNSVTLTATADLVAPAWPGTPTLTAKNASGGLTDLTTGTWYSYSAPYFEWSAATDTGGSGIAGYYVYFGTSASAEPTTQGDFQIGNSYTATVDTDGNALVSGQKYYLIVKAKDVAQNPSVAFPVAFSYWLDSTAPNDPVGGATAAPAIYSPDDDFSFLWSAAVDGNGNPGTNSGIAGYQYQIADEPESDGWSTTITETLIDIVDAAYRTGENSFYLRTIDNAGNISSGTDPVRFYYAGSGPTAPLGLQAIPESNTANSFAFSWDPPSSFSGVSEDLTYCYTVNIIPSEDNCTFTLPGVESVPASAFATQHDNIFYVVAKNPEDLGGIINYGAYMSVAFTANTSAPGIPLNIDIADVSVKNTESWKLAISWEEPSDIGSGVDSYQIYHAESESGTYSKVASTSGIAFVDTGLEQITHYYKVRACDDVNNCGAFSEIVSLYPTGKYTEPATIASGPTVSLVTTKSATIGWSTDRTSDSKVQYGKSSGNYFSEEPSNSEQVTDHEIKLSNLSPGTTYHYRARWTDEDGNTGLSGEKSFKTDPAPTVVDPNLKSAGLSSAILEFTAKGASKVKIYYGLTEAFGLVKEISTSTSETTYTTSLEDLLDGTKYYYKINTVDSEEEEYEGNTLSFETLPRPKIEEVRIQQVKGTAQTVLLISWKTNTETSSIVTYVPEGRADDAKDEVDTKMVTGEHRILLRDLLPQTPYSLVVKGRDNFGNEAKSDALRFTTATDTRAPQIIDANVEGLIVKSSDGSQGEPEAQLVVSWTTDESATAQVEYGEGTGSVYPQKTQEDASLVSNHTVVISKLTPSKVYHLRVLSKDKAGNVGESIDIVSIAPKATENALDIVFSSLKSIFGQ